jgi:hypothetical protein
MAYGRDPVAEKLVQQLFTAAGEPYLVLLNRWITSGDLSDPHQEFMVVSTNTEGWDRFILRNQQLSIDPRKQRTFRSHICDRL